VFIPLKMRPGVPRPRHRGVIGLWLTLAAVPASAQVSQLTSQSLITYQAGNYAGNYLAADGGVIYTDNVQRTSSGTGETLLMVGLSGDTSRQGTRLDYHLASNLALVKYLSSTFPTRPTGYLDGLASLKIVPGLFSWIVRDTYSQVQINLYAPVTPENLVSINNITTGPRFTLTPTLRTTVRLDVLYSYLNTSSASPDYVNFDNHRYGGDLRIERAFSEAASLYLKGHYEKVDFKDQTTNNNFSIGSAEAGYQLTNGRTVLDFSGGYSRLRVYDVLGSVEGIGGSRETLTTEEFDEPIWRVEISRLITPTQRVALSASQQFTDAASAFRLGFDQSVPTIAPPQLATGNAFKQRLARADWFIQGTRTVLDLSLVALRERYLIETVNDRDSEIASAQLTRQLSPVLGWHIGVSYERNQQVGAPAPGVSTQSSKVVNAITDLNWQVGERLAMRFIYAYSRQSGAYTDNQIGVLASWALSGSQTRTMQYAPTLSPISPVSTRSP
jgi:hypothetical protein